MPPAAAVLTGAASGRRQVLAGFGVEEGRRLEIGGLVVFASGAAAAVGSFVAPRVADLLGHRAAVRAMVAGSGAGLVLLGLAPTVWWFGVVRVVQVLCIAPLFPLLSAPLARRVQGQVLGLVNSSRIAASFVGPIAATTLLGYTTPLAVYLVMALAGLGCLPWALRHTGGGGAARAGA